MLLVIRSRFLQVLERRFQLALSFSSAHIAFLFVSQSQKFSSYEFSNICIMHNRENFPRILKYDEFWIKFKKYSFSHKFNKIYY